MTNGLVLVVCVDRDNDVGEVLGVETPIVGADRVREVALKFALNRPEDSDANALFASLQTCEELKRSGRRAEVALIAGLREEGVKADIKIGKELDKVIEMLKPSEAILVSDGPTDEQVLPILQSKLKVISVRRVIVQQSRGIEESFILLLRYMKMLVEDERYRKYSLGVPGSFVMLYALLSALVPQFVWPALLFTIGFVLFLKGFALDVKVKELYFTSPVELVANGLAAVILVVITIYGVSYVTTLPGVRGFEAFGYFLLVTIGGQMFLLDLVVISLALPFAGRIIDRLVTYKPVNISDVTMLAFILVSRQALLELGRVLIGGGDVVLLFEWILVAILVLAAQLAVINLIRGKH